jgi:hypothetical protein
MLVAPYSRPLPPTLFEINDNQPHSKTKPFKQYIQLGNPPSHIIAQVDDGALHNCIGRHIWDQLKKLLGDLMPTSLRVSIANNAIVQCDGIWSGDIRIAGTTSRTHFAVFDCNRAFDVLLGKPWLKEVKAIHNYDTDVISIPSDTGITEVTNIELNSDTKQTAPPPTDTPTPKPTPPPTDIDDLLGAEILRIETIHQMQHPFTESRWAKYLDVDPMDDDESDTPELSTDVQWFTTAAEQRQIMRAK